MQLGAEMRFDVRSQLLHVLLHNVIVHSHFKRNSVFQQLRLHVHHAACVGCFFFRKAGGKFTPVVVEVFFIKDIIFPVGICLRDGSRSLCSRSGFFLFVVPATAGWKYPCFRLS